MKDNKVMIRFYSISLAISAVLTYAIDLNQQVQFFTLNSPWISNTFCSTIMSGVLTGLIVALAAEIRQYWLHKRQAQRTLYSCASALYALLSIQHACTRHYIQNTNDTIPQSIGDEHAQHPITCQIETIKSIDYSPISKQDSVYRAFHVFEKQLADVESATRNMISLQIAYNNAKIDLLAKHIAHDPITSTSPYMLDALRKVHDELQESLMIIDTFCCTFEKMDRNHFQWTRGKKVVDEMGRKIEENPYYQPDKE